jgi:hypothetical protein
MSRQKVSRNIQAATEYLNIAVGSCEDDDLGESLREVLERLDQLNPEPLSGNLSYPKKPQVWAKPVADPELLPTLARLKRENPQATPRELGQLLAAKGYRSQRYKAPFGAQTVKMMLQPIRKNDD